MPSVIGERPRRCAGFCRLGYARVRQDGTTHLRGTPDGRTWCCALADGGVQRAADSHVAAVVGGAQTDDVGGCCPRTGPDACRGLGFLQWTPIGSGTEPATTSRVSAPIRESAAQLVHQRWTYGGSRTGRGPEASRTLISIGDTYGRVPERGRRWVPTAAGQGMAGRGHLKSGVSARAALPKVAANAVVR